MKERFVFLLSSSSPLLSFAVFLLPSPFFCCLPPPLSFLLLSSSSPLLSFAVFLLPSPFFCCLPPPLSFLLLSSSSPLLSAPILSFQICFKGHNIFKGYYNDKEKTAEVLDADGWLHSGDIGRWLPNGVLKIIDRKKHIFKLSQVSI